MVTDAERAAADAARARLDRLSQPFLERPGVTWGRMFSTEGLGIRGKIFAVVPHAGGLMVKVPESRADELVADGSVQRMVMRGREMREWVVMPDAASDADWSALLEEAFAYLDELTR
ncbi:TfoX/Sxy family protein [Protaetiibacter mangrovi]|uniref:TfoX/Sxy family protein n=1 Tax=Protaetiibacter mangrovi TaxID=2970926 RepID=A0ABT1ZI40_9MICO|nr:TfoX/Sxy family protein [Protaetiibacter mangrovi]MCS0500373.1 TfoX/Sxy family protein [Protaetiibacter mangrovi]